MTLEIYDGQYAITIYPGIGSEEDVDIKRFYNEKLGIYIKRTGDTIKIYCKILAYGIPDKLEGYYAKYSNRADPLYVVYSSKYDQYSFASFKKDTEDTLRKLGFDIVFTDETDNIIFRYIEKFDSICAVPNNPLSHKDFQGITYLIRNHECSEIKAGKVDDIAAFCREILKSDIKIINDMTIAVFTGDTSVNEYNVNIYLDKSFGTQFTLVDKTRQILERNDKKLKQESIESIKNKIKEEFHIIINGEESRSIISEIRSLENIGHDPTMFIEEEMKNFYNEIMTTKMKSDKGTHEDKKGEILWPIILAIAIFILGVTVGTLFSHPYLLEKKYIGGEEDQIPTVAPNATIPSYTPGPNVTLPTPIITQGTTTSSSTSGPSTTKNQN